MIDLCLLASVANIWLAWGVLYPRVDELGPNETFDAIVVLSGEERRIERGLELANEGRAPTLVISYGQRWPSIQDQCETSDSFAILCPAPEEDSTRGEARMVRDLAGDFGWDSILVITADYHVSRARLLVEGCKPPSMNVSYVAIEWNAIPRGVVRQEFLKMADIKLASRGC